MTGKDKKELFEAVEEIIADLYFINIDVFDNTSIRMRSDIMEHCKKISAVLKEDNFENILPRPVIRDRDKKLIKNQTEKEFIMKLQEEIKEVEDSGTNEETAEEIADIITVCISYLNKLGYDENKRSKLFAKVNEKNEKRGYFKDAKNKVRRD